MLDHEIASWLDSVHAQPPRGQKRKRHGGVSENASTIASEVAQPLTPPISLSSTPANGTNSLSTILAMAAAPGSSKKRAWQAIRNENQYYDEEDELGLEEQDIQATPRAPRPIRLRQPSSVGSQRSASTSKTSTTTSKRSGASSPRKIMRAMLIADDDPVVERTMTIGLGHMPEELEDMCRFLDDVNMGEGILPVGLKETIASRPEPAFAALAARDRYFSPQRDLLGRTPAPTRVLDILEAAIECSETRHSESSWNLEVHAPLLSEAFRGPGAPPPFRQCFDYTFCQSARIDREILPRSVPEKLVDFVVCFDPERSSGPDVSPTAAATRPADKPPVVFPDTSAAEQIRLLCNQTANKIINHTLLDNVQRRPVVLSIETKRPGEGLDKATLQVSVWRTAQWNSLLRMIMLSQGYDSRTTAATSASASLGELPFLPAIIIQGNEWYFVATTREERKTILWKKQLIGASNTVKGIYQIITALQHLRRWSYDVYWPWFRRAVLGLVAELS